MTFDELVTEVGILTGRPDAVEQNEQAVRAATLKMHAVDYFYRDIVQTTVNFPSSTYIQQLDTSMFPGYRNTAYIRKWDSTLNAQSLNPLLQPRNSESALVFFKPLSPDNIFDEYKTLKGNVYYAAANILNLRSPTAFQQILLGFYQTPKVAAGEYSSWIADLQPYAIIYDAAARIFQQTGQQEQNRAFNSPDPRAPGLIQQQIAELQRNYVVAFGY